MSDRHPREFPGPGDHSRAMPDPNSSPQDVPRDPQSPLSRRDERGRPVPGRRDPLLSGEAIWRELIAELIAEEEAADAERESTRRLEESLIEAILSLGPADSFSQSAEDDQPIEDLPVGGNSPGTATEPGVDEHVESRLARRYRVIVHNDEVTPMDFVVRVLTGVFRLGVEHAIEVMLEAHRADCALVRAFGLEEAEFRVQQSHNLARSRKYPLTFTIEPE